ncbi:MAG TPA: RusA family crossover junction endodeoxyribonuclease [Sedimentisphaerales bacterium]|nr:RusA family crossover junction endodeoxyribonuclease [Sedimentisphaerales bacterium]
MTSIQFFVPGQARPAGSKRAFHHKATGKLIITAANPKQKEWMDSVKWHAIKHVGRMVLLSDAVCLKLTFLRQRPNGDYGTGGNAGVLKASAPLHNIKVPDLTKLTRCVEDALTGIIWKDDSQVIGQRTNKRYARGDEIPGVEILVETVETKGVPDYGKEEKQLSLFR